MEAVLMTAEELLQRYAAGELDFSGVDLSGASLTCDLSEANLQRANLRNARMWKVRLRGANLSYANLSGADNLLGAKTTPNIDALFKPAILCNTVMPDGSIRNDDC